jgi:tetratricopeptide (TPR) repeat protein
MAGTCRFRKHRDIPWHAGVSILALALGSASAQVTHATPKQIQGWMEQGSAAMQAGKPADAVAPFAQAAAAQPASASILLDLALAELGAGQFAKAQEDLQHALVLDPETPGAHMFLGILAFQQGNAEVAAKELATELTDQPDNVEALTWMGIVELSLNDPEDAATALDRAAKIAPENPEILYYQGRAHTRIATNAYKALYQINPDSALVHRALAESLSESGQPAKAIAEFQAALRRQPGNADLYEELGDEDQKVSKFDDAEAAYTHELMLNPHSAIALYNLGKIDVQRGQPAKGVIFLQQAVALHAAAAPAQFYLGLGLALLNRNEEAAKALQVALASRPSPFIAQSAWYQIGRVYSRLGRKADADHAFAEAQKLKAASDNGMSKTMQ